MSKRIVSDGAHVFGGPWTEQKLAILRNYLGACTTALSKTSFKKGYIDAFAGTGQRESTASAKLEKAETVRRETGSEQGDLPTLGDPGDAEGEPRQFLDGSARVALQCNPPFDSYVFIEKSQARCQELERLVSGFPQMAKKISIQRGDANKQIQIMCEKNWKGHRAVLFLDPYGTQVRWKTIEAIAATKAIDLWVLFPLGGVNRMLTQSGDIPPEWRQCLDELLGTTDWYDEFYRIESSSTLFEEHVERVVKSGTKVISDYFLRRLRGCFAGVAPNPAVLRNSRNSPLYLFCFAAGNPKGAPIAMDIASHILKMGS
jgi:three-Cys-motif partner protein